MHRITSISHLYAAITIFFYLFSSFLSSSVVIKLFSATGEATDCETQEIVRAVH